MFGAIFKASLECVRIECNLNVDDMESVKVFFFWNEQIIFQKEPFNKFNSISTRTRTSTIQQNQ